MFSIFSRFRRSREDTTNRGAAEPTPGSAGFTTAAVGNAALAFTHDSAPPADQVISGMLNVLEAYLPAPISSLPLPNVSVNSITEKPLAIGNDRGIERRGSFSVVALKGGRLDAVVRFQIWDNDPNQVDNAIQALQNQLLADAGNLRSNGFLRVKVEGTSLSEFIASLPAWRKTIDFRVLYEFHYTDPEGAESIIAQIPIDINSSFGESTAETDQMIRWDNNTAPTFTVRASGLHPLQISKLALLANLPDGWNGEPVTIRSSIGGNIQEQTFASVRTFIDAFSLDTGTVELGGNLYNAGDLIFPNTEFPDPLILIGLEDEFRISYATSEFDTEAVIYLRVL